MSARQTERRLEQVARQILLWWNQMEGGGGEEYDRPPLVTLCGSTRFQPVFEAAERIMALNGIMVLTVGLFGHQDESFDMQGEDKVRLDRLHFHKIDTSDGIVVLNPDGYVGESTRNEIQHARRRGKRIWSIDELSASLYEQEQASVATAVGLEADLSPETAGVGVSATPADLREGSAGTARPSHVGLTVHYRGGEWRHFAILPDVGWRINFTSREIIVRKRDGRECIPLDNVLHYTVEVKP